MNSYRHWQMVITAIAALSTTTVMAQNQVRAQAFRTGGDSANDPSYLLAAESVQKELNLTEEQLTALQKLRDAAQGSHPFAGGGLMGKSRAEIQKKLDQYAKDNHERIAKILTPQQAGRLDEINIQVAGVTALNFDSVAKALNLNADQKSKLTAIATETRRKLDELNAPNNGRPIDSSQTKARDEYKKSLSKITADRKSQSMAILMEDQQAKFKRLQGEKFDTSTIQASRKSFSNRGRMEAPVRRSSSSQKEARSKADKSLTPL